MKTVFLAFAFRESDRELVDQVYRLLGSHDVRGVSGEILGGEALTPAVQARIDQPHGLIALLTRRDKKENNEYTTHPWVRDELSYARNKGMHAIALIEK